MKHIIKLTTMILLTVLCLSLFTAAYADEADFEYKISLTDENGHAVENPRDLAAGETLNIEIEMTRTDIFENSYNTYGVEYRLLDRGLRFNNDGISFRSGTQVREMHYMDGDTVGFAWYDLEQIGESINNPVLAGRWSYTVEDPGSVNLMVPVAIVYVTNDETTYEPVGNARLLLDPNGGGIVGTDVSGDYPSGTMVILPNAEFGSYIFEGWSDGFNLYGPGDEFRVTGFVTLTAQWADLVRNRHITLDPNGGEIDGADVTGFYADGEVVLLPNAVRDGFTFRGWNDGVGDYGANSEYTVYNTVIIKAAWEPVGESEGNGSGGKQTPAAAWFHYPDGSVNAGRACGVGIGGLAMLGLLLWLILLLWKRRWVLYSLKTGDVALSYKDRRVDYKVEVVLFGEDKDGNSVEYHLNKSDTVEVKHRLRFIHGQPDVYPIAEIESGKYKGKLIVTEQDNMREIKCRIKALDREIRERENK